jgi:hypothetical protein
VAIFLRYDLSDANAVLHNIGFGLYHTGIEIRLIELHAPILFSNLAPLLSLFTSQTEYTFGQGGGIGEMTPRTAPSSYLVELNTVW